MPSLDSSRSTCLVACLVARPRAAARPSPMAETARDALYRTPTVALHRLSTRLACRSCSNTLPSTRCTASNENRLMSATWGLMTCSARFVGCLRGRLDRTGWGEIGLQKFKCIALWLPHRFFLGITEALAIRLFQPSSGSRMRGYIRSGPPFSSEPPEVSAPCIDARTVLPGCVVSHVADSNEGGHLFQSDRGHHSNL